MKAICGVYRISLADGRCYVGSTVALKKRWAEHRRLLNRGIHHSPHFQCAWSKYGESAFTFELIEECSADILIEREQEWIDRLPSEFNSRLVAGTSSLETRAKIGQALLGRVSPMKGRTHSAETRAKIGNAYRGRELTREHVEKIAAANRGKKRSPEFRAQMSRERLGRPFIKNRIATESEAS